MPNKLGRYLVNVPQHFAANGTEATRSRFLVSTGFSQDLTLVVKRCVCHANSIENRARKSFRQ